MNGRVVYRRTPMGQDLYDLVVLIKKAPRRQGPRREAAIAHIADLVRFFRKRWRKDPFKLIEWLAEADNPKQRRGAR
jgi:hypothetical protein